MWLFIVLLLRYKKQKKGKNRYLLLDWPVTTCREMAADLAVAGDALDGVLFCAVLYPTRCLG